MDFLEPLSGRKAQATGSRTILLAEDEAAVRELVAAVLTRSGFHVLKARHSAEALHFNNEFDGSIHLLLTDICMAPHINGRQLAGLVRHNRPGIPVLYISGYVDDQQVVHELNQGLARFLPKPFSPDALLATVRLAMEQSLATAA